MVAALLIGAVVASAATAGAASLITGKQIKDGSISKKDLAKALQKQLAKRGPAGALGPQGPAGTAGKDGAAGANGEAGPFPDVLPRGKTLTGTWSITGQAPDADGDYLDSPVSFGFRFSAAPSVVTVGPDESGTQAAVDAGCGGTVADPKADPGVFCIYQGDGVGNAAVLKYDDDSSVKTAGGADAVVSAYAWTAGGAYTDFGGALPTGAVIEIRTHLANAFTWAGGTWAANSP